MSELLRELHEAMAVVLAFRRLSANQAQREQAQSAIDVWQRVKTVLETEGAIAPTSWTCFFCGETFTERASAALHFGVDEEQAPACRITASEGGLLKVLRETEEALFGATCALHDEGAEGLKAYHAHLSRHAAAVTSAEQIGYERGLADQAASIERLRRIVHRYGDRIPMATCHRADWQLEIDEAMRFVADNPEQL